MAVLLVGAAFCASSLQADDPAPAPPKIDIAHAPAPLFDDPVWHGASDPYIIWNDKEAAWWMYYTQRRATLPNPNGVDWVHGSAIGIATSKDGLHWKYLGICDGDHDLGDPVQAKVSWWAPAIVKDGDTFHMFVTLVHGIFTKWEGERTIEHFVSADGFDWRYDSSIKLSSNRCIDPMVLKIEDTWYLWYKDEVAGSHTFMAHSKDLQDWTLDKEVVGGQGHEAPFVWKWRDAYWLIVDAHGKGLKIYRSATGTGNWEYNNTVLAAKDGKRPMDDSQGFHPDILMQGDQCLLFYFTQFGKKTVMQMAELELGADGKMTCNRDKYLATTPPATAPAATPTPAR
jgi:predicted GH43/DUF377 family glycosyl hydrolase